MTDTTNKPETRAEPIPEPISEQKRRAAMELQTYIRRMAMDFPVTGASASLCWGTDEFREQGATTHLLILPREIDDRRALAQGLTELAARTLQIDASDPEANQGDSPDDKDNDEPADA